jgi:integrase
MARKTLTDIKIKSLKPKAGPYIEPDDQVPGHGVRVMPTGRRTFVLTARYPGSSNPVPRALGAYGELTLEQSREKARQWRNLIARGTDPQIQVERERQAALRKQRTTFAAIAEDFIKDKLPAERKGREVERDLRREFLPLWGKRPAAEITALDARNLVKAVAARAPYQAYNLFATGKRLFAWAIDQHVYGLESSPFDRLKPKAIVGKRLARKRILNDDELRAFWRAVSGLDYPYGPLFKMLALTGQRKSEVAKARWSEFNLTEKLWTIPAERMKADAAHVVPLTPDVIAILEMLPRFKKGDHLFSTDFGHKPVNGFSKAKTRLDEGIAAELGRTIPPFVIHDIRRTMRTGLSALPVPDLIRELVIAHTKPGLHRVYDQHAYVDEKRHALELWAARLRNIVEPPPTNVVPLKTIA